MSQAARAGVMAGSKAGSAKFAAPERRSHRHVSPKRLISPNPSPAPPPGNDGCIRGSCRVVPHECRPEGPHLALLRAGPLVVRTATSRGEPGEQARFVLKCFDDRSGVTCARVGTGAVAGILTGPSSGVTQWRCEDPTNASGNKMISTPHVSVRVESRDVHRDYTFTVDGQRESWVLHAIRR